MSDKLKAKADKNRNWSTALGEAIGLASPDVVDFQPLPIYPLLGVQVHGFRWQQIVEGMRKKGVVVRVHTEMDRAGLFKAASRLEAKMQSRRCDGYDGRESSWLVRVVDTNSVHSAPLDAADPSASSRGRYRALGQVVLEKGSLTIRGAAVATAIHRSLRHFIRQEGLAGRRQRDAVQVVAGKGGEFTISVEPAITAAFLERGKIASSAA